MNSLLLVKLEIKKIYNIFENIFQTEEELEEFLKIIINS